MGSCFSDNIGLMMEQVNLPCVSNPFGTVYNPASILTQLRFLTGELQLEEERIIKRDDHFFHFDFHSCFTGKSIKSLVKDLESTKQKNVEILKKSSHVFITLGTAWVYNRKEDGKIVSNCHKMPGSLFDKKLLSIEAIYKDLLEIVQIIKRVNSNSSIVFTLSPVRHIKDGIIENNRSKARLLEAIHLICEMKKADYLPAYEWVLDDLRDYRYFDEDMIHPSKVAIQYIWEKLGKAFFTRETNELMIFAEKLYKLKQHKPFETSGNSYKDYLAKIKTMEEEWIHKLKKAYDRN
jgi:hypothetical protein